MLVLLRESVLKSQVKILEKYQRKSSFFNKIANFRSANLLKMNLFTSILKYFNRRFSWLLEKLILYRNS